MPSRTASACGRSSARARASFSAMTNDSSRNSVSIIRRSLRAPRESSGACAAGRVLAGQHAARERRIRRDADAVVIAGRQDLDLGHPVQQVVVGLADDRQRHALRFAFADHFGDAPAAIVRDAEVADLAGADEVADRRRPFPRSACRGRPCAGSRCRCSRWRGARGCRRRRAASSAATGRRRAASWSSRCRPWWRGSSASGAP